MPPNPLAGLFYLAATALLLTQGVNASSAYASILIGAALVTIGHCVRDNLKIIDFYRREGNIALLTIFYVFIASSIFSGVIYGIGRLFS